MLGMALLEDNGIFRGKIYVVALSQTRRKSDTWDAKIFTRDKS